MKLDRITEEISRTREKIAGLQNQLRELERKKAEAENTQIIAAVRSADVSHQELLAFIRAYRAQGAPAEAMLAASQPAQEDTDHDED